MNAKKIILRWEWLLVLLIVGVYFFFHGRMPANYTVNNLLDQTRVYMVDVGFMANGENQLNEGVTVYVEPRCSEAHLDRILRELSLLRIKMVLGIETMLDKQIKAGLTDMDLLIISAYWDQGLELRANQLRRQNNSVTWLPIREGVNPS